jgi:hypothetical protein
MPIPGVSIAFMSPFVLFTKHVPMIKYRRRLTESQSWAVILAHYSVNSTYPGATHLEYLLIGGLSISQAFVVTLLIVRAYRHLGMRATLFIGSVLQFLGLFLSSYTTQIWHLFLTQGACFGWGMGFLYITASDPATVVFCATKPGRWPFGFWLGDRGNSLQSDDERID